MHLSMVAGVVVVAVAAAGAGARRAGRAGRAKKAEAAKAATDVARWRSGAGEAGQTLGEEDYYGAVIDGTKPDKQDTRSSC